MGGLRAEEQRGDRSAPRTDCGRLVMAFKASDYPKNWKQLRAFALERSGGRCECLGHCGLHSRIGKRRCEEMNGRAAKWAKGKVVLTTMHLCHHSDCDNPDHLIMGCQRCHLCYDRFLHATNSARTRAG